MSGSGKSYLQLTIHFTANVLTCYSYSVMACACGYSSLMGGECGSSKERPADIKCVTIRECTKEVYNHLAFHKISDDSGVDSEWKLLLARAGTMQWSIYCNPKTPF